MKLEIGYNHLFELRTERCVVNNVCLNIIYLSDFHFNKYSRYIVRKIVDKINALNPDIILLGGDYVDSKQGLVHLGVLMRALAGRENVFAVAGNHDYFFGIQLIKELMVCHSVQWIEKESVTCTVNAATIQIDGNKPAVERSAADLSILCLHQPMDIQAYHYCYDLVFAGHLHGSQMVLWQQGEALYPGRIFYKWNILKKTIGTCHYFISKGLGDTLPVRYNCRKDLLLVQVVSPPV